MFYIILRKNLKTEYVSVQSVFENKELAESELECLILDSDSDENPFAYRMDVVAG